MSGVGVRLRLVQRRGDLITLMRAARQLAKLCDSGAAMVAQARDSDAAEALMIAARQMHSELLRTKHSVEDELVTWILDCERCGRRVHWVPGEGCALGHWAHAEPAPNDHRPRIGRSVS
jgi:hypothetical protein